MSVLPDQLIKEFVKVTNDNAPKPSESFMYGTVDSIVEDNGEKTANVIFDGADITTPCKLSVNAAPGDRVMVMLKNRQAVITSNVSNPTINAGYLEAGEATFTGIIHAATYEDSTGNFTMEIGSEEEQSGSVTPAFRIGGYVNGDPENDYLEIEVTIYRVSGEDLPHFTIAGFVKSSPTASVAREVSISLDDYGVHFYGEWPGQGNRVRANLNWSS